MKTGVPSACVSVSYTHLDVYKRQVQIMNKVTIRNVKTKKEMTYTLVSESEADLNNGKIAINSPIAQGLLGKKVGDIAEIKVPSGMMTFEILNISI